MLLLIRAKLCQQAELDHRSLKPLDFWHSREWLRKWPPWPSCPCSAIFR